MTKRVTGYFTIESNIKGLTTREMEARLGFRPGRLDAGARVWVLQRQPQLHEFAFHGSTRVSGGEGLDHAQIEATRFIPGAWHNQRLVKVEPNTPHTDLETYPRAVGIAAEQWVLRRTAIVFGTLAQELRGGDTYWGQG